MTDRTTRSRAGLACPGQGRDSQHQCAVNTSRLSSKAALTDGPSRRRLDHHYGRDHGHAGPAGGPLRAHPGSSTSTCRTAWTYDGAHHRPAGTGNSTPGRADTARVQDEHVAGLSGGRCRPGRRAGLAGFDLPLDPRASSYGHGPEEVDAVRVERPLDLLVDYHEAVHERTLSYLRRLDPRDRRRTGRPASTESSTDSWDPPVHGRRPALVSVVGDCPPAPRPGRLRQGPAPPIRRLSL